MSAPLILGTNSIKDTGYNVDNSLRFDDGSSDNLSKSFTETNRKTFTISVWVKRSSLGDQKIFGNHTSDDFYGMLNFTSDDQIQFYNRNASTGDKYKHSTARFRDLSAWLHIVCGVDTTNSTASQRYRLYVNGSEITDVTSVDPTADYINRINGGLTHYIGQRGNSAQYFDGYMAEFCFIDGSQLDPTSFGEFDEDSGIWKPIDVSGLTFGTNGFYLPFENSDALGQDDSGNGNNFTVNNLTSIDQTTDTPTNNYATWNPLWSQSNGNIGDVTFSEGNLKSDAYVDYRTFPASIGVSSGKWYWEIKRYETDGSADMHTGVMSENATPAQTATWIGSQANGWVYASDVGSTYTGGTETNTGYSSAGTNDIVQVAFDADNGKIYFGVNGTWQGSSDPAAGTNPAYSGLDTSLFYFPCASTGSDVEANFGNPPFTISSGNSDGNGYGNFEYAVPENYYSLNVKNLAEYG